MTRIKSAVACGATYGKWTVIAQAAAHPKFRYRQFLCRCLCGEERLVNANLLKTGRSTSCGCALRERNKGYRGEGHPCWKGGKTIDASGYVMCNVLLPDGTRVRIREHRLVMRGILGRDMDPDETVHHKNGIRTDNRPENLELRLRSKHPSGASVSDLLKWARDIMKRYEHVKF
jgi:hypothetical protein